MRLVMLSMVLAAAACGAPQGSPPGDAAWAPIAGANVVRAPIAGAGAARAPTAAADAAHAPNTGALALPARHGPDQVPEYVALPPGARILSRTDTGSGPVQGGNLVLESRQSPAQTLDFYRDALMGSGLQISVEGSDAQGAVMMAASSDGRRTFSLLVNRAGDGLTRVSMTHTQPAS